MIPPPTMRPPVLSAKSGRWASEVLTSDTAGVPQFPAISSSDVVSSSSHGQHTAARMYSDGSWTAEGHMDTGSVRQHSHRTARFPPPPPPALPSREASARSQARFMRWYQLVEAWEAAQTADNERLIVAPPPRPPPFAMLGTSTMPVAGAMLLGRRDSAPYDYAGWVLACHGWWPHIARHFERLSIHFGAVALTHRTAPTNADQRRRGDKVPAQRHVSLPESMPVSPGQGQVSGLATFTIASGSRTPATSTIAAPKSVTFSDIPIGGHHDEAELGETLRTIATLCYGFDDNFVATATAR
jgi:hypothetical protein